MATATASDSESAAHSGEGSMVRLAQPQRAEIAAQLREVGMSTRAIGSAMGVHHRTVERALSTGANAPDEPPPRVQSLDGRSRPATQPPRPQPTPIRRPEPEVVEAELVEDDGYVTPYRHRAVWPNPTPAPGPWARQGACADLPEHLSRAFITDEATEVDDLAVEVCQRCPVRGPCGDYADRDRLVCGIWGGRRRRLADSRRARPA